MSEVYLATDERMHREVAVKVVSSTHTDYVERFQREAEAIGRLQHDHILPAYDFGEQLPWYYLVMPYIDYCTLLDKIEKGPLPLDYAGELLMQIASGLQYAHDHGVIHRDIKPSNILLRDDHFIYLADFGLARSVEGADKVTQTGVLLGTPEYMAPELADGPANKSSDIYALGILLYQMVTGKMPFTADTPLAVYLKQMREPPIPPSRLNPAIPRAVDLVILRALEKDPRRRFNSPMALAEAFNQAVKTSQPVPLSPFAQPPALSLYETTPIGEELLHHEAITPVLPVQPTPQFQPPEMLPEPIVPVGLPEKLILPAYAPSQAQASEQVPRSRPPGPAGPGRRRATPQGPTGPRRRVSARRQPDLNAVLIIALVFLILVAALIFIGVAAYNGGNKALTSSQLTQTATGNDNRVTPSLSPSPSTSAATPSPNTSLTATAQAQATQQAIYNNATAVTSLTPLLSDNLSSNTNNRWPDDGKTCTFSNGTYHVLVSQINYLQPCTPGGFTFGNCAIKVDMALLQGSNAGFIFRTNGDQFYDFEINSSGQFFFRRHDANAGANYVYLVSSTSSSAIHPNTATNTLMVIANGSDFQLFINGVFVGEVHDSTYASGQMSLAAGTSATANADASFANLNVYPTQ